MAIPGTLQIPKLASKPSAPPVGSVIFYIKTDNVIYIQDSGGNEYPFASADIITALHGDVTATGPGDAAATVVQVGGKLASEIAQSVTDTQNATSANIANRILKRDGSGNIFITQVNGVVVEAHAARHLPSGADPIATAAPITDLTATSTNTEGTANSLARSDHSHAIDTGTPASQSPDQSNNTGTSPNLARADHIHNIPTDVPVDVGSANAQGSAVKFSKADHTHKGVRSVKANSGSQRFGDLSLKNGVGATVTDDGAGNFTVDVVGGANELSVSYPGTGLSLNYTAGKVNFNGTETFISSGSVSAPASTTNGYIYVDIDGTVKAAASLPSNTVPLALFNSSLTAITFLEDARVFLAQSLVWGISSDIQTLNATNSNDSGTEEKYARADHVHAISTGTPSSQNADQANAPGSSANLARADHIHNIITAAPIANLNAGSTNSQGSAITLAKSDHSHAIDTATAVTLTPNAGNSAGSGNPLARADHVHNIPTVAPVTQNADVSNADGVANTFSKSDHLHNIPTDVPVQIGTTNTQGASTKFAKADHVHNHGNQTNQLLHALATASTHGFQSSTDKAKSDTELPVSIGGPNTVLGVNNAGTAGEYKTLAGTTNQVIITEATGLKTFSLPQDIATTSQPTFAGENLTDRLQLTEQVAPATPAATKIDIFAELSNGFTRLRSLDNTGLKSTILRDQIILVKNISGSSIGAGKAIYYTGSNSNLPTIDLAKADSSTTVPCVGVMIDTTASGSVGRALASGIISGIDTSAFAAGDKLYLSETTAGSFTNVKPTSPNKIWQRVGIVLISNASTGAIEFRPFATHGEESGTNTGFTLNSVPLTDAANIATDASLGNNFTVTLAGNRNLSAPTNPTKGQKITYRITQDATGGRTLSFDAIFNFGLDILSVVLSTAANKTDYIGCIYNESTSKWDVVAASKGY